MGSYASLHWIQFLSIHIRTSTVLPCTSASPTSHFTFIRSSSSLSCCSSQSRITWFLCFSYYPCFLLVTCCPLNEMTVLTIDPRYHEEEEQPVYIHWWSTTAALARGCLTFLRNIFGVLSWSSREAFFDFSNQQRQSLTGPFPCYLSWDGIFFYAKPNWIKIGVLVFRVVLQHRGVCVSLK